MLTPDQIVELARAQAQFLAHAIAQARGAVELMPSVRTIADADTLLQAMKQHFELAIATYERQFGLHGGFIDTRLGETPVDAMHKWVSESSPRGPAFNTLCQWVMAQRLHARLVYESTIAPVPLVALSRFCLAIREESKSCLQQSRGAGAALLAEELALFGQAIEVHARNTATNACRD